MNNSLHIASPGKKAQVSVIGAGIAGLAAAVELAVAGCAVTVFEAAPVAGGKMRTLEVAGRPIDSGPTVLTLPWVFEELFARAGASLADHLTLRPAEVIARHAFDGDVLDLFADLERTVDAIGRFAGPKDAAGYRAFAVHTARLYHALRDPFLTGARPSFLTLARHPNMRALSPWALDAHRSMMRSLRGFFEDPRLCQLFGRYATYVGSSPYEAAGTLSLIAHVEREGVCYVQGGMIRLAEALVTLAKRLGVRFFFGHGVRALDIRDGKLVALITESGDLPCTHAVFAGDVAALAGGLLGHAARDAFAYDFAPAKRSLSALTLSAVARVRGFDLAHHNVFFSADGRGEFDDLFRRRRIPREPTVYLCAQDRLGADATTPADERLFFIINAPADGDRHDREHWEIERCERIMEVLLGRSGLRLEWQERRWTTPTDFARRFPGSAGAIYGRTSHGMLASMKRPSARSKIRGLLLASGSVHPGAGVPMAALSGVVAARAMQNDLASTARSPVAAIAGSTSTA